MLCLSFPSLVFHIALRHSIRHVSQDWHVIFNRFDRDQSGTIDRKELEQALKSFGFPLPADLVKKLEKRFGELPVPF
jgi:hypothetical protein